MGSIRELWSGLEQMVTTRVQDISAALTLHACGRRNLNQSVADDIRDLVQAWAEAEIEADRLRSLLREHGIDDDKRGAGL